VRCSEADAEPRFDGVDWSFSSAVTSCTRRGVAGWGFATKGGIGVRFSMIKYAGVKSATAHAKSVN
jgi:hypothetical protein